MVDFRRLRDRAQALVNKRGGTEALKEDAKELKDIATGEGSLADRAKAAAAALKDPGAEGEPEASDAAAGQGEGAQEAAGAGGGSQERQKRRAGRKERAERRER